MPEFIKIHRRIARLGEEAVPTKLGTIIFWNGEARLQNEAQARLLVDEHDCICRDILIGRVPPPADPEGETIVGIVEEGGGE